MPTGVVLHDARERLFEAARQVLLRDGPGALTSRAVTAEAGVAKGVLHRHFADLDDFLAELVGEEVARLDGVAETLRATAGSGSVVANLTAALVQLFGPVAVAIVGLVISRDGLRARLREMGAARLPLLEEGTAMIAGYLVAERDLGRIAVDADIATIAPTLIGAAHLLFTDREGATPTEGAVAKVVATVMAGALDLGDDLGLGG